MTSSMASPPSPSPPPAPAPSPPSLPHLPSLPSLTYPCLASLWARAESLCAALRPPLTTTTSLPSTAAHRYCTGALSSSAHDEDGVGDMTAEAVCPVCSKPICCTVTKRLGKVKLSAAHFVCGGWKRGTSKGIKKDDPGYVKDDLPGTWTLR